MTPTENVHFQMSSVENPLLLLEFDSERVVKDFELVSIGGGLVGGGRR